MAPGTATALPHRVAGREAQRQHASEPQRQHSMQRGTCRQPHLLVAQHVPSSMVMSHPGDTALKNTPITVPRSSTGSIITQTFKSTSGLQVCSTSQRSESAVRVSGPAVRVSGPAVSGPAVSGPAPPQSAILVASRSCLLMVYHSTTPNQQVCVGAYNQPPIPSLTRTRQHHHQHQHYPAPPRHASTREGANKEIKKVRKEGKKERREATCCSLGAVFER